MAKKTNLGEFFQSAATGGRAAGDIETIFKQLASLGDPRLNEILKSIQQATEVQARGASLRGARMGQDISASIGSLGGGATGVGAVSRGLGASLASSQAGQARLQGLLTQATLKGDFLGNLLQLATQGGLQTSLGTLSAFTGIRQAEIGAGQGDTTRQLLAFLANLGTTAASFATPTPKGG